MKLKEILKDKISFHFNNSPILPVYSLKEFEECECKILKKDIGTIECEFYLEDSVYKINVFIF